MKILMATPIYPPEVGGPATYIKELSGFMKDEHDITVLAYTAKNPEHIDGVKLVFVDKLKPLPYRLFRFFLAAYKYSKDVDVIYAQNAVAAGLPAVLAGRLRKKPVVIKLVGDESWERAKASGKTNKLLVDFLKSPDGGLRSNIFRAIQKFTLKRVSVLTTPSQYLGEVIKESYKLDKIRLVTNYNASKKPSDPPIDVEKKKNQIMTTARLVKWKGLDGIIEAVAILKNKIPEIRLVIAGDGPEMNNLKELSKRLEVTDNVNFLGRVSRVETYHLRKESELYVLNSTYEGLPHTVLTSFSAEIPVIATNIPGTDEAVYDMQSGLLVEPQNPEDLASKIEYLLGDETLQQDLVDGATKLLNEKFSWNSHINILEDILESVVSKPLN